MRAEKIKVSILRLEGPEGSKNSKVFTIEVTPESLLGIGDSDSGLSPRTVKFNQLHFVPKIQSFGHLLDRNLMFCWRKGMNGIYHWIEEELCKTGRIL